MQACFCNIQYPDACMQVYFCYILWSHYQHCKVRIPHETRHTHTCISIYLSIYLSVCLSVYLSVCLSIYLLYTYIHIFLLCLHAYNSTHARVRARAHARTHKYSHTLSLSRRERGRSARSPLTTLPPTSTALTPSASLRCLGIFTLVQRTALAPSASLRCGSVTMTSFMAMVCLIGI